MNIAILNNCFFDTYHLKRLKKLGQVIIHKKTSSEKDAIKHLQGIEIAIIDSFETPCNKRVLESANKLKFIALTSTGYDNVDLDTASKNGIKVANVPGFSKESVAELTIGLMFAVIRNIPMGDKRFRNHPIDDLDSGMKEGRAFIGYDVKGKIFGVIGLGRIGSVVAQLANGLGMNVLAYNRTFKKVDNVSLVSLKELLTRSDVISINLSLTPQTKNIIGEKELSLMKTNAVLINVGRAGHVDTDALYKALNEKKIFGAGLDVVAIKNGEHPILSLSNAVFTPHIASYTDESFYKNLPDMIVQNIESFVRGKPINLVN